MAAKLEDVIYSLLNKNAVKSAAEVTKEPLLEVHHNLDDSFCDAHDLKLILEKTEVPNILILFSCFNELK